MILYSFNSNWTHQYAYLGGTTLFGAFDFKFGSEIRHSDDKKLAALRENLSELKIIIVDEMSLIEPDMVYKLDAKLKEIFQLRKNLPFAGIGVIFVGDLLQIPPVKSLDTNGPLYIFNRPKNEKNRVAHDLAQHECKTFLIICQKERIQN